VSETLAETARWAAAQRARESQRPDRLFDDPLATALAGPEGAEMLRLSEVYNPRSKQTTEYMVVRTRFVDDFLLRSVNSPDSPPRQVVMLAAGMDARAFRMPLPPDTVFYELDQPAVLALKQELLHRSEAQARVRRIPVPVDLLADWTAPLETAGYQRTQPSVWILEGLLFYLKEPEVRKLLQGVSECAARHSALAADLISGSFLTSAWTQAALESMKERGMGWYWGTDDPEQFLGEFGWEALAVQPGEESANYGRWSEAVFPRVQRDLPRSFFVTAEKR
jgi:methyltransferase (TIGR00027 family)